jgi:hypothetical protein
MIRTSTYYRVRTSTYTVRTNLQVFVQGVRIPDASTEDEQAEELAIRQIRSALFYYN